MKKNKLWVYGCSFSEPFGLEQDQHFILNDDFTRNWRGVEYWGSHLAQKLNLDLISKGCSGVGFSYINDRIDEDIIKWNKKDYVMISPSRFTRLTMDEFQKRDILFEPEMQIHLRDVMEIANMQETRWANKIMLLHHLEYTNVYTWLVDDMSYDHTLKNLIPAADNSINWKDWMDNNAWAWLDYAKGDWHFSKQGHIAVADQMYKVITEGLDLNE